MPSSINKDISKLGPPPPYTPPDTSTLGGFLFEARLIKFLPSLVEFGVESVHDLCDAVQSGLLDDEALAKYFPDMKTVDIRKLRRATAAREKILSSNDVDAPKDPPFAMSGADGGAALSRNATVGESYATKSPHWRDVGFLSDEPGEADFRAAGMLGLACILHVCRHHPTTAATLLRRSRLPFASIALNVVLLVASMLGVTSSTAAKEEKEISTTTTSTGANPQDGKKNWWPFTTSPSASASRPPRSIALASLEDEEKRGPPRERPPRPSSIDAAQFLHLAVDPARATGTAPGPGHNDDCNDCFGFLEVHSLALHAMARVAVDADASPLDSSALLAAAEDDLRALLWESLREQSAGSSSSSSSASSPPLEPSDALWRRLKSAPGRRHGFVASLTIALQRAPSLLGRGGATQPSLLLRGGLAGGR